MASRRHIKLTCTYDNPYSRCREVFEDGVMVASLPADRIGGRDRRVIAHRGLDAGPWKPGRVIGDKRARGGPLEEAPDPSGSLFD